MKSKRKFSILVVDDSKAFRKEIIDILSMRNISKSFLESSDGAEALQTLLTKKVDLVISDWVMPKMDGIKLLQAIRSHPDLLDLPIVLMTVKGKHNEKILGLKQGATDYISKPFNPSNLYDKIEKLLPKDLKKSNSKLIPASIHFSSSPINAEAVIAIIGVLQIGASILLRI